ncbi:MAG: MotA/TolQ/ExbB proton channel family protein [Gemmatimonadetes bacterium]|nr:MotA/TolQ/ExbB proton channel family protein [Gemmatimonadota bacterium]
MTLEALLQFEPARNALDLVLHGNRSSQITLAVLASFSLVSWVIIFWKWGQFRRVRRQGRAFLRGLEKAQRLEDAYKSVLRLPESPYTRIFKVGINFFNELRPAMFKDNPAPGQGLSEAQLEALRLVMEKVEGEEQDELAAGLSWLAIIGTVAPLLGLLGTVLGVMDAFLGISRVGGANINAVAPGIAEALIATAAGLGVAIPAVMGYNYFVSRLHSVRSQLEGFGSEFIGMLAREGRL